MSANEDWEQIVGFRSPGEYRRFLQWINNAITAGDLIEITPADTKSCLPQDRYFRARSGQQWKLVALDPPATGGWLWTSP